MITIRFDQAEIDVAEAYFQQITSDDKMTASTICQVVSAIPQTSSVQPDFDIFMTSHFHDATLLRLSTVKDPERIIQLDQESEE